MKIGRPKLTESSLSSINTDFSQYPTATSFPVNKKNILKRKFSKTKIPSNVKFIMGL